MVILAALTKRAQLPFSSWLPAAMAAPTPVSALVHSSTLVTAGVYLLIRFNVLFIDSIWRKILLFIGGLTIFIAGIGANFEFDLKKIIALSTLRQLGLIIRILAIGFPKLAFFHLLTHALFKALLFLCAGVIIHNIKNSQDIRNIGSLFLFIPFSSSCLNIANLALCGIPFLAGFYSKDLILEVSLLSTLNLVSFFLYFFSTGLTVSYSFRLTYYTISGDFNQRSLNSLNDESWGISKRIIGLLIIAVIGGSLLSWLRFSTFIIICLPIFFKNLTLFVCVLGGFIGYLINWVRLNFTNKSLRLYIWTYFFRTIWFLPFISTKGVVFYPLKLGGLVFKRFDHGWSEFLGARHIYKNIIYFSLLNQFIQNNNLKIYLIIFVFWVFFLVGILLI